MRRQRHAGRHGAAQRAAVDHHLLLGVEVGRHDLERDLQLREVARQLRGQHHVEQRLGRQQGGVHRQDVEDLEDRLGARRDQQAGEAEALAAQDLLGVRANELGRQPGRVGGTEDRPDRGAGDDVGLEAQLIEHLQHQDVRQPARAAAAQRQRDRGPHAGSVGLRTWMALLVMGPHASRLSSRPDCEAHRSGTQWRTFDAWLDPGYSLGANSGMTRRHAASLLASRKGSRAASASLGFSSAMKWPETTAAPLTSVHQPRQMSSGVAALVLR